MAFFSGLKAAYDSLGSEISKSFDSSQEGTAEGGNASENAQPRTAESIPAATDEVNEL